MIAVRDNVTSAMPLDTIICGDALDALRSLPDASVDAIVTDPPYFRVKGEAWDRQWDNAAAFLAWMALLRDEWARILKPNGSLYVFASPRMAARVEVCIGERFNVLNQIVWRKHDGYGNGMHSRSHKEDLRGYFPQTERIIFAEHYGADSMALGESGYAAQCEKARGHIFEPLRAYLDGERRRAGITPKQVEAATKTQMHGHWFTTVQWALPTAPHYATLQHLFNEQGRKPASPFADFHPMGSPFARFHRRPQLIEYLRADYEELRADYEELRRPFAVTADNELRADTWTFAGVPARAGRHPCEKPLDLMRHIIRSSTRPDAVVLDCFAGSGATLEAARSEGRRYLGIEREARYVAMAEARLRAATGPSLHAIAPAKSRKRPTATRQQPTLWNEVSA